MNSKDEKKAAAGKPYDAERSWRVHRRVVRAGQAFMLAGAVVALTHWLAHIEAFGPGQPPGWVDLVAGYPAGGVLVILGAVLAGRKRPMSKKGG